MEHPRWGLPMWQHRTATIEVVHRMSKFNIFIISYSLLSFLQAVADLLLLSLLQAVADCYCSLSCKQLQIVIALFPASSCRLLLLSFLQVVTGSYCFHSCRQLLWIIVLTPAGKLQLNIAFSPADNYRMLLFWIFPCIYEMFEMC